VASDRAASDYFDRLAPEYDVGRGPGGGLWHRSFFAGRRRIALGWLEDVRTGAVADVGCGPGVLTAPLKERGVSVIALDRAPAMLAKAAEGGALAVNADALGLPVRDGSCEAAVALGLSSYVDDLTALLREMKRIVRPGGVVIVSVANSVAPDWLARRALRAPARALGFRGLLTSDVTLRTRSPAAWRAAALDAGLRITGEIGHDFTLFPLSRVLPGPSVVLGRSLETFAGGRLARFASEVVLRMEVPGAAEPRPARSRPRRIVRVIARLNIGGPAMHACLTTAGLRPGSETVLATGRVDAGEEEAGDLLREYGVEPVRIRGLGRAISALDDVRAFFSLWSLMRRVRPDVVHTHTAKAGALGRVAAWLARVPFVVHTFHGHVFRGYFGAGGSRLAVWVERALARVTDRVVAVSDEVGHDLTDVYGVVPKHKLRVVPIGLPLEPFLECERHRGELRAELGVAADTPLVGFVGRLVPVKAPDVALDAWRLVRAELPDARLVVVGAGPLLDGLRARGDDGVHFLGWRRDTARIAADLDLALLTSVNEGTPVALIEAAAAGVPAVSTRVGGVPTVVKDDVTGLLADAGDAAALAAAVVALLRDPDRRREMGAAAREHAGGWSAARLLRDLDALYDESAR